MVLTWIVVKWGTFIGWEDYKWVVLGGERPRLNPHNIVESEGGERKRRERGKGWRWVGWNMFEIWRVEKCLSNCNLSGVIVGMVAEGFSKDGLEWFSQSILIDSLCCIEASLSMLLDLTTGLMVPGITIYLPWGRSQIVQDLWSPTSRVVIEGRVKAGLIKQVMTEAVRTTSSKTCHLTQQYWTIMILSSISILGETLKKLKT